MQSVGKTFFPAERRLLCLRSIGDVIASKCVVYDALAIPSDRSLQMSLQVHVEAECPVKDDISPTTHAKYPGNNLVFSLRIPYIAIIARE